MVGEQKHRVYGFILKSKKKQHCIQFPRTLILCILSFLLNFGTICPMTFVHLIISVLYIIVHSSNFWFYFNIISGKVSLNFFFCNFCEVHKAYWIGAKETFTFSWCDDDDYYYFTTGNLSPLLKVFISLKLYSIYPLENYAGYLSIPYEIKNRSLFLLIMQSYTLSVSNLNCAAYLPTFKIG